MEDEPSAKWLGEGNGANFIGQNNCRIQGGHHNSLLRRWQSRRAKLSSDSFMYPVFISANKDTLEEITSLPGQFKVGINKLVEYLKPMVENGLKSVLLFSTDVEKTHQNMIYTIMDSLPVVGAIPILRLKFPQLTIACDVCLCGFLTTGLCHMLTEKKIIRAFGDSSDEDYEVPTEAENLKRHSIDYYATLKCLSVMASRFALIGAHIVAPSDMNDGRVEAIDKALKWYDLREKCSVMSYSAKFASCMYGPFRGACESVPILGDRNGSQLPPGSSGLASRAVARDINENADIVMVKPAMMYLDIIRDIKHNHPNHPIAAYQVSGEYSMIQAATEHGPFDLKTLLYENFECMQRAGVDIIISYFTPTVLKWIMEDEKREAENLAKRLKKLQPKDA